MSERGGEAEWKQRKTNRGQSLLLFRVPIFSPSSSLLSLSLSIAACDAEEGRESAGTSARQEQRTCMIRLAAGEDMSKKERVLSFPLLPSEFEKREMRWKKKKKKKKTRPRPLSSSSKHKNSPNDLRARACYKTGRVRLDFPPFFPV